MAKLKSDEIKWILSIDAKGVNKEIAVASSQINKLSQENKMLVADMKLAEKQIVQQEKEMQKLTNAGKKNSEAYQEAKATRDSARNDVDSYTVRISENNKAIKDNTKKISELKQGMDLSEMSMKQLRERASELGRQLNVTSLAANPKEYAALQKELSTTKQRMTEVQMSGRGLMDNLASIPGPVGATIKSIQILGTALKALIANPVGAVIMAIVGAFTALKAAINSSEEASNKFQQLLAPIRLLLDSLLNILQKVVGAFLDFTSAIQNWVSKAAEKLPIVGKYMEDINKKSEEAIQLEKDKADLRKREYQSIEDNAKKEAEIADLRFKSKQRDIYTNNEIVAFLDKAITLESEIAKEKIEQAKNSLNLLELEASRKEQTEEMNKKLAEQRALLSNLEAEEKTHTRNMESERQTTIRRMQNEDTAAAKEAINKQMSDIESALLEETKLLTQQLADNLISREEYEKAIENVTMASLRRKLEIAGLEKDKRIDIEQQVLDAKIAAMDQEKKLYKEREKLAKSVRTSFMDKDNQELEAIKDNYTTRLEELKLSLEKEAITELEYNEYKTILLEEQEKALNEQNKINRETKAAEELAKQDEQFQQEQMKLLEQYANKLINEEAYQEALLALQTEYAHRALEVSNLSDEQQMQAREKLLSYMVQRNQEETKQQEEQQKKRAQLYSDFSVQIGETLGNYIGGQEDLVKSSLKSLINMALDALKVQVQIAIAGVTAQGLAQSMLNPTAQAKAAIKIALIEAAFAAAKSVVNSAFTSSASNTTAAATEPSTGHYIIGRQDGGFMDVSRAQDGRRFIAKFNPNKRGFINSPTVIVGDGPAGKSNEWVASNDAVNNPTIAPFIKLLDESQKAGTIRTIDLNHIMRARMAGFESGGYIDRSSRQSPTPSPAPGQTAISDMSEEEFQLLREVKELLLSLKNNGVKAPIVFTELERKRELLENSRNIGRK